MSTEMQPYAAFLAWTCTQTSSLWLKSRQASSCPVHLYYLTVVVIREGGVVQCLCAFPMCHLKFVLPELLSWHQRNSLAPSVYVQELLQEVKAGPWETLARRRVQHFGYKFEYVVRSRAPLDIFYVADPWKVLWLLLGTMKEPLAVFPVLQSRNVDTAKPIEPPAASCTADSLQIGGAAWHSL